MRSKLIYSADNPVHHEFLLASLAIQATRRLRASGSTRTEDRMNQAFRILAKQPSAKQPFAPQTPKPATADPVTQPGR